MNEEKHKCCLICNESKSAEDFYKQIKNRDGLDSYCKSCSKKKAILWQRNNKEKDHLIKKRCYARRKEQKRNNHFVLKYGITLEEYNKKREKQGDVCAICGNKTKGKSLAVDHNHVTGEIRGLLCIKCNTRLAVLEDREFYTKAKKYLSLYGKHDQETKMHKHNECNHEIKYCKHCDVCYCEKCGREWGKEIVKIIREKREEYPWPWNPWRRGPWYGRDLPTTSTNPPVEVSKNDHRNCK